jgi:hypothetical protein
MGSVVKTVTRAVTAVATGGLSEVARAATGGNRESAPAQSQAADPAQVASQEEAARADGESAERLRRALLAKNSAGSNIPGFGSVLGTTKNRLIGQ